MARKLLRKYQTTPARPLALEVGCTALYVRVSTERQASEGFSLEAQHTRLTAYCAAHHWQICSEHVYADAGLLGTSTEREGLRALLAAAERGEITRVVALKLDRLARNVRDFLHMVDMLKTWGCDLVLLHEDFDTGTPHGKFALTMFAAMAELEAATLTERVMTGKEQKAQEGGYNGSRIPLGYDYAGGAFTPNVHAATVRAIFRAFLAGASLNALARTLDAQGVPTARGGHWAAATVRYVLLNGFYAGLSQWATHEGAGTHPPLIDPATYQAAQTRLDGLRPGKPTRNRSDARFLLHLPGG